MKTFKVGQEFIESVAIPYMASKECPWEPTYWAETEFGTVHVRTKEEHDDYIGDEYDYRVILLSHNPLEDEQPDLKVSVLLNLPGENRSEVAISYLNSLLKAISEVRPS